MGGRISNTISKSQVRNFHTTRSLSVDVYTLSIEITEALNLSAGYFDMALDELDFANSMINEFKIEFSQNFTNWNQELIDYRAKRLLEIEDAKAECIYHANQALAKLTSGEWLMEDLKSKDPNCTVKSESLFKLLDEATSKKFEWKDLAADTDWAS